MVIGEELAAQCRRGIREICKHDPAVMRMELRRLQLIIEIGQEGRRAPGRWNAKVVARMVILIVFVAVWVFCIAMFVARGDAGSIVLAVIAPHLFRRAMAQDAKDARCRQRAKAAQ